MTFRLPENFDLYPAFMFHLRRSQFLQVRQLTPPFPFIYIYIQIKDIHGTPPLFQERDRRSALSVPLFRLLGRTLLSQFIYVDNCVRFR